MIKRLLLIMANFPGIPGIPDARAMKRRKIKEDPLDPFSVPGSGSMLAPSAKVSIEDADILSFKSLVETFLQCLMNPGINEETIIFHFNVKEAGPEVVHPYQVDRIEKLLGCRAIWLPCQKGLFNCLISFEIKDVKVNTRKLVDFFIYALIVDGLNTFQVSKSGERLVGHQYGSTSIDDNCEQPLVFSGDSRISYHIETECPKFNLMKIMVLPLFLDKDWEKITYCAVNAEIMLILKLNFPEYKDRISAAKDTISLNLPVASLCKLFNKAPKYNGCFRLFGNKIALAERGTQEKSLGFASEGGKNCHPGSLHSQLGCPLLVDQEFIGFPSRLGECVKTSTLTNKSGLECVLYDYGFDWFEKELPNFEAEEAEFIEYSERFFSIKMLRDESIKLRFFMQKNERVTPFKWFFEYLSERLSDKLEEEVKVVYDINEVGKVGPLFGKVHYCDKYIVESTDPILLLHFLESKVDFLNLLNRLLDQVFSEKTPGTCRVQASNIDRYTPVFTDEARSLLRDKGLNEEHCCDLVQACEEYIQNQKNIKAAKSSLVMRSDSPLTVLPSSEGWADLFK